MTVKLSQASKALEEAKRGISSADTGTGKEGESRDPCPDRHSFGVGASPAVVPAGCSRAPSGTRFSGRFGPTTANQAKTRALPGYSTSSVHGRTSSLAGSSSFHVHKKTKRGQEPSSRAAVGKISARACPWTLADGKEVWKCPCCRVWGTPKSWGLLPTRGEISRAALIAIGVRCQLLSGLPTSQGPAHRRLPQPLQVSPPGKLHLSPASLDEPLGEAGGRWK